MNTKHVACPHVYGFILSNEFSDLMLYNFFAAHVFREDIFPKIPFIPRFLPVPAGFTLSELQWKSPAVSDSHCQGIIGLVKLRGLTPEFGYHQIMRSL